MTVSDEPNVTFYTFTILSDVLPIPEIEEKLLDKKQVLEKIGYECGWRDLPDFGDRKNYLANHLPLSEMREKIADAENKFERLRYAQIWDDLTDNSKSPDMEKGDYKLVNGIWQTPLSKRRLNLKVQLSPAEEKGIVFGFKKHFSVDWYSRGEDNLESIEKYLREIGDKTGVVLTLYPPSLA